MVALDFSGKRGQATVATTVDAFVSDIAQVERLRPHTVRAYRYELAAAAADARFQCPLDELPLEDLDSWLTRAPAATSTVGRRVATFRRFFGWACRHGRCTRNPLADRAPLHGRRRLPRPIREHLERRVLDAAIGTAPQPYRLIFTLLRETGVGPSRVTTTCWQCGQAGMLAHATTTRQRRKFQVGRVTRASWWTHHTWLRRGTTRHHRQSCYLPRLPSAWPCRAYRIEPGGTERMELSVIMRS